MRTLLGLRALFVLTLIAAAARGEITGTTLVGFAGGAIHATHAPGDEDRLFIVQREGEISILDLNTNQVLPTPFLEVNDVDTAGEGGLLSMAFHPDYATNGKFYVYVTVDNGGVPIDGGTSPFSTHIREYTVSANPDIANSTAKEVLSFPQPRNNHNGGWIGFSPDTGSGQDPYLYITSGDGGKQGDPDNNAQTLTNDLLGKVLRIDVDGDDFPLDANQNYAIPASNPLVGVAGDDEIWSHGLRNPFRASFDRDTGDLWIADVGQNTREEINRQPGDSPGGEDYGWNRREGLIPFQGGSLSPNDTQPVYDYTHGFGDFQGRSVTGGVVYRGPDPTVDGDYLFADFVSNNFWRFDPASPTTTIQNIESTLEDDGQSINSTAAFAEDAVGNVYIVTLGGGIFRIDTDALRIGDYDADGDINGDDFATWSADFGLTDSLADGNDDGDVSAADYAIWRGAATEGAAASVSPVAVPEPATFVLFMAMTVGAVGRRSRR